MPIAARSGCGNSGKQSIGGKPRKHQQRARVDGMDRVEQLRQLAAPAARRADSGNVVDTDRNQHHVDAFIRRLLRKQLRDLARPQAARAGGPPMDLAVAMPGQRSRGTSGQRVLQRSRYPRRR